ncbi:MAG: N-acetylmuramoyl-L-alanine amidase [Rhodospirillales bacterium]|nr:N-acetylmuramoyl-L-alanine amidase [Rhodospirillales bacterium]
MSMLRRNIIRLGLSAGLAAPGTRFARAAPPLPLPPTPPTLGYPLPPTPPAGPRPPDPVLPYVMIDPGHGGSDPGTIGPGGVMEKTITLETGFALHQELLATGRYRVGMTRTADVFVTLSERVVLAMHAHADLFISLHCNHFANPGVRGAMIFTLSRTASDGLAGEIASTENSFDRGPVDPAFRGLSRDVAVILGGLEMQATDLASERIAAEITASFRGYVALIPDPERSANFAVLRDPIVPSTLIEMGCLSNAEDVRILTTPAYRALIAARITAAAGRYFARAHPTRVAG